MGDENREEDGKKLSNKIKQWLCEETRMTSTTVRSRERDKYS